MDTFRFRPVINTDSGALLALIGTAYSEYPGCVLALDEVPELVEPGTWVAQVRGKFWVAEREGQLVGCVALIPAAEPATVELKKLYVAATVRGLGLGRRLIELAEAEAQQRGALQICLWTDTRFETAHGVYEHLGYLRLPGTRELQDLSASVEYQYQKKFSRPATH